MAKPTKLVPGIFLPDTRPISNRPITNVPEGGRLNIDIPPLIRPEPTRTFADITHALYDDRLRQSSLQVTEIPVSEPTTVASVLRTLTWPAENAHLLSALGSESGLFTDPDGNLYAHVENAGHIHVRRQPDNRYRIPLNTPKLPDLFLSKSERQATWNFERPDWLTEEHEKDASATLVVDYLATVFPTYLEPADAARLTSALDTPDGIRYDKHRKTYVDTVKGTVMVRKNAEGEYQQAYPKVADSPDIYFERIPDTPLWRHKNPIHESLAQDRHDPATPMEDLPPNQTLIEGLLSIDQHARNLPNGLWRKWGKQRLPRLGQHIEIDGHYYRVVPQELNADSQLVYLQHPLFSPALYDAFEEMLRDNPSLQPKWAINRNGQWIVLDTQFPFQMPITQYISRTFKYLSDQSVSTLARTLFNEANAAEIITGHGLATLNQTFRYWAARHLMPPTPGKLADPLMMLPDLSAEPDTRHATSWTIASSPGESLQHLELDPARFPRLWNEYATTPTIAQLRKLFSEVLQADGYIVSPALPSSSDEALLFYRENLDVVFVLQLPPITNGRLHRSATPLSESTDSLFDIAIGSQQQPLATYRDSNRLVYLLGGVQTDASGQTTLFIIREG
ncbi:MULTISPECIES: hypothetical protein [unclassified Pseudomonas]|uniref:hypothetical protein n=1 Tax=unclassified Pseudomonas TaxID=196821 RepID=UPI001B3267FE|nr:MULTISPECIES: hypothetical protein [unclassified Pseudomonas]MBP5944551.1 hypothetical protein [Pseudomonas sp. P9(2020)]MBZ9561102.1 hypothetical protein [Pseudomonas sp. P116]